LYGKKKRAVLSFLFFSKGGKMQEGKKTTGGKGDRKWNRKGKSWKRCELRLSPKTTFVGGGGDIERS